MDKQNQTAEQFAQNIKYLRNKFGAVQSMVADAIDIDHAAFSRYINGTKGARRTLEDKQYFLAAEYLLSAICKNQANTLSLCERAGLETIDYRELKKDGGLRGSIAEKLMYAMKDKDFSTESQKNLKENALEKSNASKDDEAGKHSFLRKALPVICLIAAVVLAGIFAAVHFYRSAQPRVVLEITAGSDIGEPNSYITGTVRVYGGGSPDDYAVTVAVVSPVDGRIYAPKPSYANPSSPVTLTDKPGEGRFTCVFADGYADADVEELYVYVIPADFVPGANLETTKAAAAVSQRYVRT